MLRQVDSLTLEVVAATVVALCLSMKSKMTVFCVSSVGVNSLSKQDCGTSLTARPNSRMSK